MPLALWLLAAIAFPGLLSWQVARDLAVDNACLALAAWGATIVIISGGIDLSIGSVMALAGVLTATLPAHGVHPALAAAAGVGAGLALGAMQGVLIARLALPAFLVTLAGMFLARGLAFWVSPVSVGISHPLVTQWLPQFSLHVPVGPRGVTLPLEVCVVGVMGVVMAAGLAHTRPGRAVYAVGSDARSAALMGLGVATTRTLAYSLGGACSGLAGVVLALGQQSGDPASGKGLELDAIAAVVIGGTLLRGGSGGLGRTTCGVLTLGLVQTILSFHGGLSSWWARIATAGLVLGVVLASRLFRGSPDR